MRAHLLGARKGEAPVIDCNEIRLTDSHEAKAAKVEFFLAKSIGEDLCKAYPGREWGIDVDSRNQMVVIMCHSVSLKKGYYLPMHRDTLHDLQLRARKAAAEILERYGVSRNRIINPDTLEAMDRTPWDEVIVSSPSDTRPEPMK